MDGSNLLFEAYIVGGSVNDLNVNYDYYFGAVLTTIEDETCLEVHPSGDSAGNYKMDFAHTTSWMPFTYSESASDLNFSTGTDLFTHFNLDLDELYDYTNPTWCSTPATFNTVTDAQFDVTSVCGVDFNGVVVEGPFT